MGEDKVLGQDFEVATPTAENVNVTADSLTELQRAGLTAGQAEALGVQTDAFGNGPGEFVPEPEADDEPEPDAVEPAADEVEPVGNEGNDAIVALAPDASEDDEHTGPMPTFV